jgi:hypothetical protein
MKPRHSDDTDEIFGHRGERPTRGQRPSDEEEAWDEADDEWVKSPRRRAPRSRRPKSDRDEDDLDPPPHPSVPWLPPARR